jgi:feruloyl esterase
MAQRILAVAVLAAGLSTTVQANSVQAHACDLDALKAPENVTLVTAKSFTTPVDYCRIDGYVTTDNPGPNKVRFMVALPQKWSGRYLFTVQGGAAGFIPDPGDTQLKLGYAIASTDKGVRAAHILDFSFRSDPAQALDWGHRGVHVASLATQALLREYYAPKKVYRYVTGCSGGGDGTLTEAEKYPSDFDAFLPGAMTYNVFIGVNWGYIAQRVNRNPNAWISPEEMKHIGEVIMKDYDASDGAVDGLIWEPWKVELKREAFAFLNDYQFGTLLQIASGLPKTGPISYPGYWMGNPAPMSRFLLGLKRPPWTKPEEKPAGFMVTDTAARGDRGATFDVLTQFDYTSAADMEKELELTKASGRTFFDPEHLQGLKAANAKMIMWSGAADQAVPPMNLVNYTNDVAKDFGAAGRGFFRSFLAPGMFHCVGGENQPTDVPDQVLDAAVNWVERGKAPEQIVTTNAPRDFSGANGTPPGSAPTGKPTRTYLLCAYPKRSVFKGGVDNPKKLDVSDAKNWHCES